MRDCWLEEISVRGIVFLCRVDKKRGVPIGNSPKMVECVLVLFNQYFALRANCFAFGNS